MLEKVRRYIEEYHMLQAGDTVVAGVSGGADSVCLLLLLKELAAEIGFTLSAVHVEHGIRGEESRMDAAFTERLCREADVPFALCSVDVPRHVAETGKSPEEAARELRFDCYRQACAKAGADRIALAHHADDCAETMLFHLARGTGIRGLCGIRPVSEQMGTDGQLMIIRPLLCLTRDEIEEWLAARGQEYRTDSTNADVTFARNRIRERVMPELEQVNAQAVPHMLQLSGQMAQISDYLEETAWEAGRGTFSVLRPEGDGIRPTIRIDCDAFLKMHPVLRKQLLIRLIGLAAGGRKDIAAVHVEQVLYLMTAEVGAMVSLPCRVTAAKTYDAVELSADAGEAVSADGEGAPWEKDLAVPGETVLENGLRFISKIIENADFSKKIPRKSYTKWFDYDKIESVVRLRSRRPGDYLQTDASGGHKKLNRFFIDEKVPLEKRDNICLLADGSHILWIVGFRISEACKVTEETKRVLSVTVCAQNTSEGEDTGWLKKLV